MKISQPRLPDETLVQIAGRIAQLGGWIADLAMQCVFWSDEVCGIVEVPCGSSPGIDEALGFYPPEWRLRASHVFYNCVNHGVPFDEEMQIVSAGGNRKWVRVTAEPVYGDDGRVNRVQGAFQDITAAKHADYKLRILVNRFSNTLESITEAVIMVDREWRFTFLNSCAERLLHCPRAEVLGMVIWDRFPDAVGGRYYNEYHRAVTDNCAVKFEEYYAPFGLWTEIRAYPSEEGLAVYFLDIGERKVAEERIHMLAYYDKLTSLPNREMMLSRLEAALAANRDGGRWRALMIIDLDNFKSINDTRGHDKGDMLLQLAALRLRATLGGDDMLARFGGDEFVILLHDLGTEPVQAAVLANVAARKIVDCFVPGFEIDCIEQFSSASIGVALFDGEDISAEELLKRADLAMYQAKAAGRNAHAVFTPEMQSRLSDQVALEADLRHGLTHGHFLLHYQPLAEVDGRMTGVEALVRWNHPVRGMVAPDDFIRPAEESGLILPLGQWVMRTACKLLARWAGDSATAHLSMAVNVSAHQLHRPDFIEQVLSALADTGASPQRLKLEITESLLVNDIEGTIAKMTQLNDAGVRFSLDDFGTGYSSLSYLHRLPLSQLKIDKSFVRDALDGQQGAAIAHTILALGRALKLNVLAEGVETAEQLAFVSGAGCSEFQGFLYSRPLPEEALTGFIAAAAQRHAVRAGTRRRHVPQHQDLI